MNTTTTTTTTTITMQTTLTVIQSGVDEWSVVLRIARQGRERLGDRLAQHRYASREQAEAMLPQWAAVYAG